jgi:hypothetical protein
LLAKHVESALSQGFGDLRITVPVGGNTEFGRHATQLHRILNGVAAFSFRCQKKRMGYITAVIGVRGCPARHHAHQVPSHNRIRIRSTSASPRPVAKRIDAAGAHITNSATDPELTEAALRLLRVPAVPGCLEFLVLGVLKHFLCSTVNALLIHSNLSVQSRQ